MKRRKTPGRFVLLLLLTAVLSLGTKRAAQAQTIPTPFTLASSPSAAPGTAPATPAGSCTSQGGACAYSCPSGETSLGALDCAQYGYLACCKASSPSPGVGTTIPITPGATTAPTGNSGGIVPCGSGNSQSGACTLCSLIIGIYNLIQWGRNILLTISVVMIFIAGVMYIVSAGTGLAEQAKKALSAALVGFTVVLTAWLIIATVMWILSANNDLGIGKANINWQTGSINFSCAATGSGAPVSATPVTGPVPNTPVTGI